MTKRKKSTFPVFLHSIITTAKNAFHSTNHVLWAFVFLESSWSPLALLFILFWLEPSRRRSSCADNSWRISFSPMRTIIAILSRRWDPSRGAAASNGFNCARSAWSCSIFVAYWEHFNWTAFWRMFISGWPTESFGGLFFNFCCFNCSGDKASVLSRSSSSSGRTSGKESSGESLGTVYPSSRSSNSSRNSSFESVLAWLER